MLNALMHGATVFTAALQVTDAKTVLPAEGGGSIFAAVEPVTLVWALAAIALVIAGVRALYQWVAARRTRHRRDLPPLLFAAPHTGASKSPAAFTILPVAEPAIQNGSSPSSPEPVAEIVSSNGTAHHRTLDALQTRNAGRPKRNGNHKVADEVPEYEGTLQLLPGRLEPVNGESSQEIRFIRTPGGNRFTLGRSAGPLHTHIQLDAPTTSRMHAYMEFQDGRWRIGNMSQTNSVVVNGSPLEGDATRWLQHGDHIELGQLIFVFRNR